MRFVRRARHRPCAVVLLALTALAGCRELPRWQPVALPSDRHGHRLERVAGGLLVCGGFSTSAGAADHDSAATLWLADGESEWRRLADMPSAHAFFGSTVHDGALHALGDGVLRCDGATHTWQSVVPAGQLPRSHFGSAQIDGVAYVLGGYPLERSAFWAVDLALRRVDPLPPPPGFRPGDHFHFLAAVNGELHVLGGLDGEQFHPLREHWVLRAGTWVKQPDPPAGLWQKFGGQALVAGGWHVFGEFGHWRYEPGTGAWTERARMPYVVAMPATLVHAETIWVVGGMRSESTGRVLLAYDTTTDSWRDLSR
ncbi:MAG: hypothetical protein JNL28_16645 [Planctomycetes bacterium]|nr:hypothetical protein [Planctomycetota bacterium]